MRIFRAVHPLVYPRLTGPAAWRDDFDTNTRDEEIWVAQKDGPITGFASIYLPAKFIHHLYVDPTCHRRGIGRALLELALRRCGGHADLKCDEANRAAQGFYLAAGFRPVEWGWAARGPWIRYRF
ncbi:MAG TPA: GNAT family N-acetyltransferase [Dongiaceae bacterium]|nr:GNAT family N-acetyltransferase [Dongiaceae bacterium]